MFSNFHHLLVDSLVDTPYNTRAIIFFINVYEWQDKMQSSGNLHSEDCSGSILTIFVLRNP
jgi:hypothetical protein